MCPSDAFTTYCLPRYLLIVFALAGDSTITRAFAIFCFQPAVSLVRTTTVLSMIANYPNEVTTLSQSSCPGAVSPDLTFPARIVRQSTQKSRYPVRFPKDRPNVWRYPL